LKNAITWLRRICFLTTTFSFVSIPLEHVLGDIQTDRGNLHVDGFPDVIGSNYHLTAIRRRERAPSTTSKPDCLSNVLRFPQLRTCPHWLGPPCAMAGLMRSSKTAPSFELPTPPSLESPLPKKPRS
jgi:hypothetical protein